MSQKFNENEKEYVWHDGVRISDEQLISMARNAGSYALAEHYLFSLLAHGTMYGLTYYINKVNEVRAQYGVMPIQRPSRRTNRSGTTHDTPARAPTIRQGGCIGL